MGAFESPKTTAQVLAAAGPFLASQMTKMPGGAPGTGGGRAASDGRCNTLIVEVLRCYRSGGGFVMSSRLGSGSW